jgi:predicted chitinase
MDIITPRLMHDLTGYREASFDEAFCKDFNLMLKQTGFDKDHEATKMLMANLMHESCNFLYMKEIASGAAYEGRADLGNTHFEHFYEWLKEHRGIDDKHIINDGTSYVADVYPFEIAIDWIQRNDLLYVCQSHGFESCCVRINGGHNGYADRLAKYHVCQRVMG